MNLIKNSQVFRHTNAKNMEEDLEIKNVGISGLQLFGSLTEKLKLK